MRIVLGIFAAVGIIFLAIGGLSFYKTKSFESKGILTQGTVIEMIFSNETNTRSGDYTSYAPVVIFVANDNKEHTFRSNLYTDPPTYSVGDMADIYYNPANPDDAMLGGASAFLHTYVLGGLGLLFSGIAAAVYFFIVKNIGTKELMKTGRKIQADIISLVLIRSKKINRRNRYVIRGQWTDILDNKVYSFISESILFDPRPFLANRNKIDVYIDQNNPKKYFMDIPLFTKQPH